MTILVVEGDAYLSRELQQVMVHVFANQNCSSLIEWGESYDAGTMLCAGEYSGGKDSCQVRCRLLRAHLIG